MRRFRFTFALMIALLLLSAAVRPQTVAAQAACDPNAPVQLVSIGTDGLPVNTISFRPSMSADGRYALFYGQGYVGTPPTLRDVLLLRDRLTCQSEIVSLDSAEGILSVLQTFAFVSNSGRFVTFVTSEQVVPEDTDTWADVYLRDRQFGQTTLVSVQPSGAQFVCLPALQDDMSSDGRYILFHGNESPACALTDVQLYVRDMVLNTTEMITVSTAGIRSINIDAQLYPDEIPLGKISDDGNLIVFSSNAGNLVANDTNADHDLFLRNRQTSETTRLVTLSGFVNPSLWSGRFQISANGRFVTFGSNINDLVPGDTNGLFDVFVYNLQTQTLERLATTLNGQQIEIVSLAISGDGRYIYQTGSANNNIVSFIRDRQTGMLSSLPSNSLTNPAQLPNVSPEIMSDDGRYVSYATWNFSQGQYTAYEIRFADWQRLLFPPPAPTPISPIDAITETQPTFTWNTVQDGAWYSLWVEGSDGHVIDQWYDASTICVGSNCSVTPALNLPTGWYQWWIQAWSPYSGYGAWNSGATFTVNIPPAAPVASAPTGIIAGTQATFTWNAVPGTTWYNLWLNDESGVVLNQWYDASTICANGVCSLTPPLTLNGGLHRYWVQGWSPYGGYSPWSAEYQFGVVPAPPVPTAPTGIIAGNQATFTWNAASGASWYDLWLNDESGIVLDQWYNAYEICANGVCSVTPPVTLDGGLHRYWLQTWSAAGGYSAWSPEYQFGVAPAVPTQLAPLGTAAPDVSFQWTPVQGGAWYFLWLNNDAGNVFNGWFDGGLVCSTSLCETNSMTLAAGNYHWWIQAWSPYGGSGALSGQSDFSISSASLPVEVIIPEVTPEATPEATSESP